FKRSTSDPGETIYTKHYDRYWSETRDESQAAYVLEIAAKEGETINIPVSYYPESAVSLSGRPGAVTVSSGTTVRLKKAGESGCRLVIEPNSYEILQDKIMYSDASVAAAKTAMIPIHLDCSGIDVDTEISVINEIGSLTKDGDEYEAIADIYLCDVDEGVKVTVYTVKGVATSNSVSTRE